MQYVQTRVNSFICLCVTATFFVACNSSQSSDKTADTVSASMAQNTPDTVQTTVHDTVTVVKPSQQKQPATAPEEAAPTQPAAAAPVATPAPAKPVTKKKVRIIVERVPVGKYRNNRPDNTGVYEYSEVSPMYQGGQAAIQRYINNHIEYPQRALDDNKQGRVGVSFVVNETGRVTNVQVIGKGLGEGLDQEAVRVVSSMPNWRPGTIKGRPVKTRVTLPIIFRIDQ